MEIRYINSLDDRNELSNIYEQSWRKAYRGIILQKVCIFNEIAQFVIFLMVYLFHMQGGSYGTNR